MTDNLTRIPVPDDLQAAVDNSLAGQVAIITARLIADAIAADGGTPVPPEVARRVLTGITTVTSDAAALLGEGLSYDRKVMICLLTRMMATGGKTVAEAVGEGDVETALKRAGMWPPAPGTQVLAAEHGTKPVDALIMVDAVSEVPDVDGDADAITVGIVEYGGGYLVEVGENWLRPDDALNLGESIICHALAAMGGHVEDDPREP